MFDFHQVRRIPAALMLCVGLMLGLAACSISSDDDDDAAGSGSQVTVITISGGSVSVEGTWFGCSDDGGSDYGTQYVFAGQELTITTTTYASTDLSCSTGEAEDEVIGVDAEAVGDELLTDWTDGAAVTSAPPAQDGETGNADPPTATIIELTSADTEGVAGRLVLLMDDTGETPILYRGHDQPAPDCSLTEEEPWEHCLINIDTMEKQ